MKYLISTLFASLLALPAIAPAQTLDELLQEVQRAAQEEARVDQERLQRFQRERDNQQQLLVQARAELAQQQERADSLSTTFESNEQELAELDRVLDERLGNLGELFGVVRQVSGDVRSRLVDSMVSAQLGSERAAFLGDLAERTELPTLPELRRMWQELVREIAESGKVVRFNSDIINTDGERESDREVVRVGVFTAVSDGSFLLWDSGLQALTELPQQPPGRYRSLAAGLQDASPGSAADMAVDFSRGAILESVGQTPTIGERVRQGGLVGYVIIALGIFGVLFALWKGLRLFFAGGAIKRQVKREEPSSGNALGRVLQVYHDNPDADTETLELKLDEAILRETAPLEAGLPLIKVLYVVAPLIGLLGTVVGMIVTFQQIVLFGTGEPRMMAGGISMALITTVLGLSVAIPLTIIHSLLHSRARMLIQILEEQAAGVIARVAEKRNDRVV